jgi:TolA-binding protein
MALAQKKVSRKELKQDPLIKAVAHAQEMAPQIAKFVAIAAAAIVAIVIAVVLVNNSKTSANQDAAIAIAQARQALAENKRDQAEQIFEEASARYKGTTGGAEALYSLAEISMAKGEYQAALDLFTEFEKKYPKEFMLDIGSLSGIAAAQENLGNFEDAAIVYEKILKADKFGNYKALALYNAGRCWKLAANTEKAKEYFNRVVEEYPETDNKREAERELVALEIGLE